MSRTIVRFQNNSLIFSATDLVNFLGCSHATYLDRRNLDVPVEFGAEDPLLALLQDKGLAHERRYLESLVNAGKEVVEISSQGSAIERRAQTIQAMRAGAEVIYQGALSVSTSVVRVQSFSNRCPK